MVDLNIWKCWRLKSMLSCFLIRLMDFSSAYVSQRFLTCIIASTTSGHRVSSILAFEIVAYTISMIILSVLLDTLFSFCK